MEKPKKQNGVGVVDDSLSSSNNNKLGEYLYENFKQINKIW